MKKEAHFIPNYEIKGSQAAQYSTGYSTLVDKFRNKQISGIGDMAEKVQRIEQADQEIPLSKFAASKYEHIDFKPPQSVADAAKRGLELRKNNKGKGGLSSGQAKKEGVGSGVQRATNLKNRDTMSPATVKRMKAFFDRHEKSKKIDKGETHATDEGYIAWMLWGGDPGRSWANKVVKQMEAADKKAKRANYYAQKYGLPLV